MSNFLLESNPDFDSCTVKINGDSYRLQQIKGNGCVLTVHKDGIIRDQIELSRQDLKALFLLLSVKKDCVCGR